MGITGSKKVCLFDELKDGVVKNWMVGVSDLKETMGGMDDVNMLGGDDDNPAYGGIFGGKDEMQTYVNNVYTQNKEKLIRNIAEEVFKVLKLKGSSFAKTAPIEQVVQHLAKVVPNPRKGGSFNKSFNSSSGKQKEVCDALINAVNNHYGSGIIDTTASMGSKCQQVSEVMNTLLVGMNTEFMQVAGDVLRTLKNMQTLNDYISA